MLYTKSNKPISKIGIGTWTINKEFIDDEIRALNYYFKNGVNYIDVVLAYNDGAVLDVVAEFLKSINREDLFINAYITFGCNNLTDIKKQIDYYLNKLNTEYIDCITLHCLDAIGFSFEEYVGYINSLKESGKVSKIGYSNLSPEQLKSVIRQCDFFEGLYNLECKMNEDNGILEICNTNSIPFFAYQPLRRNRTAQENYQLLLDLANKYNKTQNQIVLNWLLKHKNIRTVIKSSNIAHIKENLGALDFVMEKSDYLKLDSFRAQKFDNIKYSYKNEKGKVRIDQIPNQY